MLGHTLVAMIINNVIFLMVVTRSPVLRLELGGSGVEVRKRSVGSYVDGDIEPRGIRVRFRYRWRSEVVRAQPRWGVRGGTEASPDETEFGSGSVYVVMLKASG